MLKEKTLFRLAAFILLVEGLAAPVGYEGFAARSCYWFSSRATRILLVILHSHCLRLHYMTFSFE
jgi:hypothetical protein